VAGAISGRTERELTIHLKGGDLFIEWRDNNRVYMTGAAEEVFQGTVKV
jgi:diaminopimelate epimerase